MRPQETISTTADHQYMENSSKTPPPPQKNLFQQVLWRYCDLSLASAGPIPTQWMRNRKLTRVKVFQRI